jgi:hypothetical protein
MNFGIQMGHGMKGIADTLLEKWGGGTLVLSPRNSQANVKVTAKEKLISLAHDFSSDVNQVLVDPQLFSVKSASKNLELFPHWQLCSGDLSSSYKKVVREIIDLNRACECKSVILPSATSYQVDQAWKRLQLGIIDEAIGRNAPFYYYATVALGFDVIKDIEQVDSIIAEVEKWNVEGVYLVCEHFNHEYLTDQPLWLLNLMLLVAGIKRAGKKVLFGYASHQMLQLSLVGCDYMFSGNFLNVRKFQTETFEGPTDDSISRRTKWYYVPQTLSEFKVTTLDIAYQLDELNVLRTPYDDEEFVNMLFNDTVLPSNTNYNETYSFKHYLHCLKRQCEQFTRQSYLDTYNAFQSYIQTAELILMGLKSKGIFDSDRNFARQSSFRGARNFTDAFSASVQSISAFDSQMRFIMEHEWSRF